jgi:hypothetical protein
MKWPAYTGLAVPAHPRTALWWQQREQCQRCARSVTEGDTTNGRRTQATAAGGLRCSAATKRIGGAGSRAVAVYCIDARDEGGRCGPEAKLFEAAP